MLPTISSRLLKLGTVSLVFLVTLACNKSNVQSVASASEGKVPITTKSEAAKKEFLEGQNFADRLLAHDSVQHFDNAISLDPDFASAELARANSSPTGQEFFAHQQKAIALMGKASEGEQLQILASQAGANGDVIKQKEYLEKLVEAYPNDERVQFTLANFYFGQQQLEEAAAHYKKATEIAPNFSPAYNLLGYAHRQEGDYSKAEDAFKKYVELIPNDPNPYDSYAELLMKMGRLDDSITQYRKALSVDSHFNPSHFGISGDLMYKGQHDQAVAELQSMADNARNDNELRTAYFGMAVVASDRGQFDKAIQAMDKSYAVAEKKNDAANMSGDLQAKGNIYLAAQRYDDAEKQFARSLQVIEESSLSPEIKKNAQLQHEFNEANVALAKKDYAAAKTHAETYRQGAEASHGSFRIQQAHELAGRLAFAQKDYDTALSELERANQQDPSILYRISLVYQAKGDADNARDYAKKAAEFYSLPQLNYAFVRAKAQKQEG
jgi:tetratricopeptide (TPR) repeat protein